MRSSSTTCGSRTLSASLSASPTMKRTASGAISQFFEEARKRPAPYNVFLAADIFGYVCWNPNDTCVGQKLETLAPLVDYIWPMLYPSGFRFGIPGYRIRHPTVA